MNNLPTQPQWPIIAANRTSKQNGGPHNLNYSNSEWKSNVSTANIIANLYEARGGESMLQCTQKNEKTALLAVTLSHLSTNISSSSKMLVFFMRNEWKRRWINRWMAAMPQYRHKHEQFDWYYFLFACFYPQPIFVRHSNYRGGARRS